MGEKLPLRHNFGFSFGSFFPYAVAVIVAINVSDFRQWNPLLFGLVFFGVLGLRHWKIFAKDCGFGYLAY